MIKKTKYRKRILLTLPIIIAAGLFTKLYTGPAALWVNNCTGGLFYEIFWCLVIAFILPNKSKFIIASAVLLITCGLEFLQLWHPLFLDITRNSFIGRTLLGHSFAWSDFPYYFIGAGLGYLILIVLGKKYN